MNGFTRTRFRGDAGSWKSAGTRATIRAPRIQGRISGLGRSWARSARYDFASAIVPGPMPQTKC